MAACREPFVEINVSRLHDFMALTECETAFNFLLNSPIFRDRRSTRPVTLGHHVGAFRPFLHLGPKGIKTLRPKPQAQRPKDM